MTQVEAQKVLDLAYGVKTSEDIDTINYILEMQEYLGQGEYTVGSLYKMSLETLMDIANTLASYSWVKTNSMQEFI